MTVEVASEYDHVCSVHLAACGLAQGYDPCEEGVAVAVEDQNLPDGRAKDLGVAVGVAAVGAEGSGGGLAGDVAGKVGELEALANPIVGLEGLQLLQLDKLEDAHLVGEVQTLDVEPRMTVRFSEAGDGP